MKKLIVILFLLVSLPAYGATVTRYVNTASAGGDGTTNAESGANAAYASLNAWEAAEATDLVTAGDSHIVYVSTGSGTVADTTAVTISGWTTDATHTVTIEQASSDAHGGVWNTAVYRLDIATGLGFSVSAGVFLTVKGLQMSSGDNSAFYINVYNGGAMDLYLLNSVLKGNSTLAWSGMIVANANIAGSTFTMRNNIVYAVTGSGSSGILLRDANTSSVLQNNTLYNNVNGIRQTAGTVTVTNNITRNCTDGFVGTFATASDYNSSDISGDAPNTGGSGNDNTASPWYSGATADSAIFVDAANDDYHLTSGSTIFDSVGANLYSTFTDDIDEETRPDAAFDLGADEYISAGGVTPVGLFMMIN